MADDLLNKRFQDPVTVSPRQRRTAWKDFIVRFRKEKFLHLLVLPAVVLFFIFSYVPMYGIIIAFKDFSLTKGILGSPWIGFEHFIDFFKSIFFVRLTTNTILLSTYSIIFGAPVPIIFAILLNEVRSRYFRKVVQTVSYLPYFVSIVVAVSMIMSFTDPYNGVVNALLNRLGYQSINFMQEPSWFRFLYVVSGIWQGFGWSAILYFATLSGISEELYEAAVVDGASRFQQIRYITIPGIMPTVIILFILQIGGLMNVGFEKIILMYNPATYGVADVISSYVYRKGLAGGEYSFGAAVGLFNNVINFALIFIANKISRKMTEIALW